MKTLLAKFFKSLACRVAIALVTTATVAKAHDLPQHFPHAPTDWGMIQQDCMGHRDAHEYLGGSLSAIADLPVTRPDAGSPPGPMPRGELSIASTALVGPELYDGVDCAHLESMYRSPFSADLVEYTPSDSPTLVAGGLVASSSVANSGANLVANSVAIAAPADIGADDWQFHKSHFAACTCAFENRQAEQIVDAPKFVFDRICIADYFASLAYRKPALVLRDWQPKQIAAPNFVTPLARAVPVQNKALFGDALAEFETWDCVVRGELYQFQGAARVGEFAANVAKTWVGSAVPSVSNRIARAVNEWQSPKSQFDKRQLAQRIVSAAPQFIIYQTAVGNEVAVPIAQARNFDVAQQPSVSPEFQQMVDAANARLQWAGGRLSTAASVMNDWFSQRVARARVNELR